MRKSGRNSGGGKGHWDPNSLIPLTQRKFLPWGASPLLSSRESKGIKVCLSRGLGSREIRVIESQRPQDLWKGAGRAQILQIWSLSRRDTSLATMPCPTCLQEHKARPRYTLNLMVLETWLLIGGPKQRTGTPQPTLVPGESGATSTRETYLFDYAIVVATGALMLLGPAAPVLGSKGNMGALSLVAPRSGTVLCIVLRVHAMCSML